jgi:hypothetical protein
MNDLTTVLNSTGESLVNSASNGIKPLRELKDEILPRFLAREFPAETRCCSFLLITFFDDIFYNMTGDFPQERPYGESVDKIRREFFKVVGNSLSGLAHAIESGDANTIFKQCSYLITTYLDSIETINYKIERATHES